MKLSPFATEFHEKGFVKLQQLFKLSLIEQFFVELSNFEEKVPEFRQNKLEVGSFRFMASLPFKGIFSKSEFYAPELLMDLIHELIGEKIIINSLGLVNALPGAEMQHTHRDNPNLFEIGGPKMIERGLPYAITVGIPLVKTNNICGGTRFWPGSHLHADQESGIYEDVYCDQGDVILFDYRVLHCGLPNLSNHARPMIYNVYSRPWFRDNSNFVSLPALSIGADDLSEIPEKDRAMFNWATG